MPRLHHPRRARRFALLALALLAGGLTLTGALEEAVAHTRHVPGYPQMQNPSYERQPPPSARDARSDAPSTPHSRQAAQQGVDLAGLVVATLVEAQPEPAPAPGEDPGRGSSNRTGVGQPDARHHVEQAVYRVRASTWGQSEFLLVASRLVPVPDRMTPEEALREATLRAERDNARAVARWAAESGAASVSYPKALEAARALGDAITAARERAGEAQRLACVDTSEGTGCVATNLLVDLRRGR